MTANEIDARTAFEMCGFNEEQTGGGCTAWRMGLGNGREVLVTDGDLSLVLDMQLPCIMSLMDGVCGEPVKEISFSNAEELMAWFDRECNDGRLSSSQVMERCYA